jgi:hypothetical protein
MHENSGNPFAGIGHHTTGQQHRQAMRSHVKKLLMLTAAVVVATPAIASEVTYLGKPCSKWSDHVKRTAAWYEECTTESQKAADRLRHRLEERLGVTPELDPDSADTTQQGRQVQEREKANINRAAKNPPHSERSTVTGTIKNESLPSGGPTQKVSRPKFLGGGGPISDSHPRYLQGPGSALGYNPSGGQVQGNTSGGRGGVTVNGTVEKKDGQLVTNDGVVKIDPNAPTQVVRCLRPDGTEESCESRNKPPRFNPVPASELPVLNKGKNSNDDATRAVLNWAFPHRE